MSSSIDDTYTISSPPQAVASAWSIIVPWGLHIARQHSLALIIRIQVACNIAGRLADIGCSHDDVVALQGDRSLVKDWRNFPSVWTVFMTITYIDENEFLNCSARRKRTALREEIIRRITKMATAVQIGPWGVRFHVMCNNIPVTKASERLYADGRAMKARQLKVFVVIFVRPAQRNDGVNAD